MANWYEFKVKWCFVCDQGWIEIVKGTRKENLFLQCSECFSQWEGIDELNKKIYKLDEEEAIEPDSKEIIIKGWGRYIIQG
ncbi:hypothetical protein ACFSCX_08770 [Bacillus salitolerans]|uniref:Uncharacterized protein n=1 Tax=Bacillus salitolerans TaxID=1437434 RepID=A0ABW4LPP0_9BACI